MLHRIPGWIDDAIVGRRMGRRAALAARLPVSLAPAIRHAKFRALIRYVAAHSRFYQRRFRELGLDPHGIRTPDDLGAFYTTPQDLLDHPVEDFLCAHPELGFESSGTTATTTKRIYFSRREVRHMARDAALGLYNLGLRADDRVIDAFSYAFWNAPFALRAALDLIGCFHVTATRIPPADFYDRARPYGCNVMFVEPSWLVVLTEIACTRGTWPVKFIFVGGENMSEATRRYVEDAWRTKVYLGYGQTEAFGQIGSECPAQHGYHLDDFNLECEVVDRGEDGYGELVYSTLSRRVMPLVRYRSTDITAFVPEPCTCGLRITRRITKLRGRSDEMISCGMGHLTPAVFDQVLGDFPAIAREWQVGVLRAGNHDTIEFRIELTNGATPDVVTAAIKERVRDRWPDAWRNYQLKLFEFGFQFKPPGSLSGGRKVRRLVDERNKEW